MYNNNDNLFHGQIFYDGALDEMQVSNMMRFLDNPKLVASCSEEEIQLLIGAIKNHYVEMAKKIIDIQNINGRSR